MNLNRIPTIKHLASVLKGYDDDSANHILWVNMDGDVLVEPFPNGVTYSQWEASKHDSILFKLETFGRGNGYVGKAAAEDDEYLKETLKELVWLWEDYCEGR